MITTTKSILDLTAADLMSRAEEEGGPSAELDRVRACPWQTKGRLLNGEEAVICTLVGGSCPMQEIRPMMGGRYTAVCLLPPPDRSERQVIENLPSDPVGRYLTADVVTVEAHTPLPELARLMLDAHIHRVVVIDEHGKPIGVVSSRDVIAAVAREEAGFVGHSKGRRERDE